MKMITIFRLYSVIFLFGYFFISIFNFFPAQNTINLTVRDGLPTNKFGVYIKPKMEFYGLVQMLAYVVTMVVNWLFMIKMMDYQII